MGTVLAQDSEILKEDDNHWPAPDRIGRQELEVVCGKVGSPKILPDAS